MKAFECGFSATQGERGYQEDSAVVWPGQATFAWNGVALPDPGAGHMVAVLADGMGGHVGGALASKTVCKAFLENYASSESETRARLSAALDASNDRIADIVQNDPSMAGMGSTLVGVIFDEEGVQWVSVGDSPLYLYRRGEIALLNEDHSLAPVLDQLAAAGKITVEQAKSDPHRHMLRSAITGEGLDHINISKQALSLEVGDYVIVASDGIHTLDIPKLVKIVSAEGQHGPLQLSEAIVREIDKQKEPYQDNAQLSPCAVEPENRCVITFVCVALDFLRCASRLSIFQTTTTDLIRQRQTYLLVLSSIEILAKVQ